MRIVAKFIFFKLLGWNIQGTFDTAIKKCVIIVVPHTSWHDFYIGVFSRKIINLPMHFVAKKELFRFPFGGYFRWMGGNPIDRSSNKNKVEEVVKIFQSKDEFRLAIAPEGTRKKVTQWKTGFYYIAFQANVPIIRVAFDYKTKTVKIAPAFYASGNYDEDFPKLKSFYEGVVGKVAAYS